MSDASKKLHLDVRVYDEEQPTGIKSYKIIGLSLRAFLVPKEQLTSPILQRLIPLEHEPKPSLYFLFGQEGNQPTAYIGQTKYSFGRTVQQPKRDCFDSVVFFVCEGSDEKCFATVATELIEKICIENTYIAGRYKIKNNQPGQPCTNNLGRFYQNIKLLLGVLGYNLLEPKTTNKTEVLIYEEDQGSGIKSYKVPGLSLKAISIPRVKLTNPKLHNIIAPKHEPKPGVYFLLKEHKNSDKPPNNKPEVYIGETKYSAGRIVKHDKKENSAGLAVKHDKKADSTERIAKYSKEYDFAIIFICEGSEEVYYDTNLIETTCIINAEKANKYKLMNRQGEKFTPDKLRFAEESYFYQNIKLILKALEYDLFEDKSGARLKKPKVDNLHNQPVAQLLLTNAEGRIMAAAMHTEDKKIKVLKDSLAHKKLSGYEEDTTKKKRGELIDADKILVVSNNYYEFKEDHIFNNPGLAAKVILLGKPVNGPNKWKNKAGIPYRVFKEWQRNYNEDKLLLIRHKGITIAGAISTEGKKIKVLKGSLARKELIVSAAKDIRKLREELINNKILKEHGEYYQFQKECPFKTQTAAAQLILARHANGRDEWRTWKELYGSQEASKTKQN